jgi:hypothetical protein
MYVTCAGRGWKQPSTRNKRDKHAFPEHPERGETLFEAVIVLSQLEQVTESIAATMKLILGACLCCPIISALSFPESFTL